LFTPTDLSTDYWTDYEYILTELSKKASTNVLCASRQVDLGYPDRQYSITVSAVPFDTSYWGIKHDAANDEHVPSVPKYATNITFRLIFGHTGLSTNLGVKLNATLRTLTTNNTVRTTILHSASISSTNGYSATGTNRWFEISMPVPTNHYGEVGGQLKITTGAPLTGGLDTYTTNGVWFIRHTADVPLFP
jgi:hypothetical protein